MKLHSVRKGNPNRGFALVVTLTMLSLLMLVGLGLLSLSSISVRGTQIGEAQAQARANARMALMIAIGELQKELGPDQRVNAPANQENGIPEEREHWVGVYESWNSFDNEDRPDPKDQFRRWLVSGDEQDVEDETFASSSGADDVILFQPPSGTSGLVKAPKVEVAAQNGKLSGAYAWWVGDENAKAKLLQTPESQGLASVWTRTQAAPAPDFTVYDPLADLDREAPEITRLISGQTLDILVPPSGNEPPVSDAMFHDFTTHSLGVIADVQQGGLKKDLSMLLDVPVSETVPSRAPSHIRDLGYSGALYPNGITFEELWLYHNVWRALEPPMAGLDSPTGGNLNGETLMLITAADPNGNPTGTRNAFRNDPFTIYKALNYANFQWIVYVWAMPTPDATEERYDLYFVTDSIATLWNPYDVPQAIHPEGYEMAQFFSPPYSFVVEQTNESGNWVQIKGTQFKFNDDPGQGNNGITNVHNGRTENSLLLGTAANPRPQRVPGTTSSSVVLMPGEVMLVSEKSDRDEPPRPYIITDRASRGYSVGAEAGWNYGKGRRLRGVNRWDMLEQAVPNRPLRLRYFANSRPVYGSASDRPIVQFSANYGLYSEDDQNTIYSLFSVNPPGSQNAPNYPDVFPPSGSSDDDRWINLPEPIFMTGAGKFPIMTFSYRLKTESSLGPWNRFRGSGRRHVWEKVNDPTATHLNGMEVDVKPLGTPGHAGMPQVSARNPFRGFLGTNADNPLEGKDIVITRSIPREPPLSLGAFQHAIANGYTGVMGTSGALSPTGFDIPANPAGPRGPSLPEVSHSISNSFALPMIPLGAAETTIDGSLYQDHSWRTNNALWDTWFLSSIVQQQSPHHVEKRTARQVFEDFTTNNESLPNQRMVFAGSDREAAAGDLFGRGDDAYEAAASYLMIDGAFNVQSTSVEAWKAVLSSLQNAEVPTADVNNPGNIEATRPGNVPVPGLLAAHSDGGSSQSAFFTSDAVSDNTTDTQWRGVRALDPTEIENLAAAIVDEIRARGPFLSLADFINRNRAANDDQEALSGPLQAALDRTVNESLLNASGRIASADGLISPEAGEVPKTFIGPAYVRQADLLTAIGSHIAVRSDTFRIRAYGEAHNAAGETIAQAWCEAVVQRTPTLVDDSQAPETTQSALNPVNEQWGRRFNLISFRWMASDEINA